MSRLLDHAKNLRKKMTKEERHLWYDFLRKYPLKIYKQKVIGNYIVDFYCHAAMLVIELDGGQHYEEQGMEYDRKRTAFLEDQGLYVLRFSNMDVNRNFEGVCLKIDMLVEERLGYSPLSQLR